LFLLHAWETGQPGTSLVMRVPEELLREVAVQLDLDPAQVEIADRFQLRDPLIEHIGWALKADIEAGRPAGLLYLKSLGAGVAAAQDYYRSALEAEAALGGAASASPQ